MATRRIKAAELDLRLDRPSFEAAREHLLADDSLALIRFMAQQSLAGSEPEFPDPVVQIAQRLGWIDPRTCKRTTTGVLVSDSCREYLFWKERGQALPFAKAFPHVSLSTFQGKSVAEIGTGMGANLMTLAGEAGSLCGVEPVEAFIQLGRIFRAREGMDETEVRIGWAEALPFRDKELDLALCVTSHQYFDIRTALPEIARVLRPGGELIIIGGTMGHYAWDHGRTVLSTGGRGLKDYAIALINTVGYQAIGRRVLVNRSVFSTVRPIFPTARYMVRQLNAAGFDLIFPLHWSAGECCFHSKRRENSA